MKSFSKLRGLIAPIDEELPVEALEVSNDAAEVVKAEQALQDFKIAQAGLESSFGLDTKHVPVNSPMHQGDRAVGRFGLMPKTLADIIRKGNNPQAEVFSQLTDEEKAFAKQYKKLTPKQLAELAKKDPKFEESVARQLAKEVLFKNKGDVERATYAWEHGHNRTPDSIPDDLLERSDRVRRFRKIQQNMDTARELYYKRAKK